MYSFPTMPNGEKQVLYRFSRRSIIGVTSRSSAGSGESTPRIATHHANRDLGNNGPTRMRFGTIVERTRSLSQDKLQSWRRIFTGCSKSRKCHAGGKSKVEKESDSSEDDDESRSLEHTTIVTVRSYDERVSPDTGVSIQPGIPPARLPRLSGNFFPQIAPLGDSCSHDRGRSDDDAWIAGDSVEIAGLHPRHRSGNGRSKGIVEVRTAAKRSISLPEATRETASTVHPANSRTGSRDSLPSKQEARPPIAVAREGKDKSIFRQGKDKGGKVRRVGETGIDGEPRQVSRPSMPSVRAFLCGLRGGECALNLLLADDEDYMDSLLLEA